MLPNGRINEEKFDRMRSRAVPEPLYTEVFEVVTRIKDAVLAEDPNAEANAVQALRRIYDREAAAGSGEPFLTEALADFTDDPRTGAALYELSIEQSRAFPDEPLHTKRIGLAHALIELGDNFKALNVLEAARFEANRNRDADSLQEISELCNSMRFKP
jgi:hypothetical protein